MAVFTLGEAYQLHVPSAFCGESNPGRIGCSLYSFINGLYLYSNPKILMDAVVNKRYHISCRLVYKQTVHDDFAVRPLPVPIKSPTGCPNHPGHGKEPPPPRQPCRDSKRSFQYIIHPWWLHGPVTFIPG